MCQHLEIKININKNGGTHCIQTLYYDREGKIDVQTKVKFERVCVCVLAVSNVKTNGRIADLAILKAKKCE